MKKVKDAATPKRGRGRPARYDFSQMKVGDPPITLHGTTARLVRGAARGWAVRQGLDDAKFSTKTTPNGDVLCQRTDGGLADWQPRKAVVTWE